MNRSYNDNIIKCLELDYGKTVKTATVKELYNAV